MPEDVAKPVADATSQQPTITDATPDKAAVAKPVEVTGADDSTLLGNDPDAPKADPKKDGEAKPEAVKGDKADPSKADASVVPEKYEFKVPEGMNVDQALADAVSPIFKELKLTQEGVDKLTAAYAPHVQKMVEAQKTEAVNTFKSIVNEWKDQTMKVLGNEPEKEMSHASKAISKFSDDPKAVRQVLNETGLGNHPAIVKLLVNAGKALAQDHVTEPSKSNIVAGDDGEKASRMYPSMNK